MSKDTHDTHAHDDSHAHDDHGHGNGHGDDAGEIIAVGSPSDFLLMVFALFAAGGIAVFSLLMIEGAEVPHLTPNAGPGMYVGVSEPEHHGEGHGEHGEGAHHEHAE